MHTNSISYPNLALFALLLFCLLQTSTLQAQTPVDAIMMKQGEICLAAVYEHSWFDHYWEGDYLRTNGTIATVHRTAYSPMIAIGLFDRLNLLAGAPYVQTRSSEPNGGKFQGAKGFQDLSLALKGLLIDKDIDAAKLQLLTTVGFSTPISNYLSDYRPYSIGFGAPEYSFRGILQYRQNSGFYTRIAGAYLLRGQTEAERDYYYNNGSYYTAWMDVPNAWEVRAVAGMWLLEDSFKAELAYQGLRSTSGDDVRPYNAAQPTNKVHFDQLNLMLQYYLPKPTGLGVLAYYGYTLNGRNTGKASVIGAGLTYLFSL
ncbi:MAG: transporter [Phaeodactylibacter sp.]|nr:transporter [Phaeodactylibacter sp.]